MSCGEGLSQGSCPQSRESTLEEKNTGYIVEQPRDTERGHCSVTTANKGRRVAADHVCEQCHRLLQISKTRHHKTKQE